MNISDRPLNYAQCRIGKCPNVQYSMYLTAVNGNIQFSRQLTYLQEDIIIQFIFQHYIRFILKINCRSNKIYIHTICIGGWNNWDRIRSLLSFFFSPVVPTLRTGTLFWEMDSSMPLIPSCRYVVSAMDGEPAARERTLAPGWIIFCSEWMTGSLLSALLLAFHRAAHVETFFFFLRPDMSPPVTGLRRKVGVAVMSTVRRLAVRVHLDHRAVLIKSVDLSIEYKYQIFNIHLLLIYLF